MKKLIFWIIDKYTKRIGRFRRFLFGGKYASLEALNAFQLIRIDGRGTWKAFENTGLTTKQDLRKFKPKIRGKKNLTIHYTSGSTGEPLKIYGPEMLQYLKVAVFERAWQSVGWNGKDWILRLTAGEPKWTNYDWWRNVKPMNYRTINQEYADWVIKHKPFLIHGGSGAIRELTDLIISSGNGGVLKDIKVYLMSEDTTEHREVLEKYYKKVHMGYGLAELCTVASECEYGNLHVNMETCIVEIVEGEIVVTDLFNTITPVIRYRTGDYGKLKESNCLCGSKHDILYNVTGRGIDYYNGLATLRPLSWWMLSPLSHKYAGIIDKWKVEVNLKKKLCTVFIVWKDKKYKLRWYKDWIKKETGLNCRVITRKAMPNKKRMRLLKVK